MTKKTVLQLEMEKYTDDAVDKMYKCVKDEVKKEFAIKLVEGIVFAMCGAILLGFLGFLLFNIGWKR